MFLFSDIYGVLNCLFSVEISEISNIFSEIYGVLHCLFSVAISNVCFYLVTSMEC